MFQTGHESVVKLNFDRIWISLTNEGKARLSLFDPVDISFLVRVIKYNLIK